MMDSNEKMHSKAQNDEKVSEKKSENKVVDELVDAPVEETEAKETVEDLEKESTGDEEMTEEQKVSEPDKKSLSVEEKGPEENKEPEEIEKSDDKSEVSELTTTIDQPEEKTEEEIPEVSEPDEKAAGKPVSRTEPEKGDQPAEKKDIENIDEKAEEPEKTEEISEVAEKEKTTEEPGKDVSVPEKERDVEAEGETQPESVEEKTEKKEDKEDKTEDKAEDLPVKEEDTAVDYSTFTEVELINAFRGLLEKEDFVSVIPEIDAIKINFYKKHKLKLHEQKKQFLEDGGMEEEFKPEADPYEQDMKALMQQVRQKKAEYNKDLEAEKDENLKLKYEIIEEIKNLINRKESINKTFQEFRDLQQKWREVGLVPQASMKDLWENYHHHVENFYDYIKINKELRDLDLKKNMEEKIILCEKAEALLLEPSVLKAFNTLQKYHDLWREIGPVPREKKEELWERFRAATNLINKKHQEFFENRKKSQKKNLEAKTALCEKVEEILELDLKSHKDWEDKSKELIELQKYWRTIGFAPKKDNTSIYERFRINCDKFFDKKREFYTKHKEIQNNNLQLKIDLCMQAEALKDSTDWKKATDEFINIQKKWKEIGPVPRKQSDTVWKRFRAACDYFFKQKSEFFNTKDETQVENLKLKNDLIKEVVNFKSLGDDEKDFECIREFQRRWNEIGFVPIGDKKNIQKKFRDAINVQFDKLKDKDVDRNLLKFRNKVTDWKTSSRGHGKMYAERERYITKLKHLENDLITLKNNVGFFADSKNAEALIKDVERKIARNEEQIDYLKNKIKVIDSIDSSEEEK